MNLTLLDFDKSQKDLKKYFFESDFIRFLDFTFNYMSEFQSKERLSIRRFIKGKGKDSKLVIAVRQEWACKDENGLAEFFDGGGEIDFGEEDEAVECFLALVEEAKRFIEANKKNILWDGMRYFWKTNKKGEMERVIDF